MKKQTTTKAKAQGAKATKPKQNNKPLPKAKEEEIQNEPIAEITPVAAEVVVAVELPVVETPPVVPSEEKPDFSAGFPKYAGDVTKLTAITVGKHITNVSWNQHLPCPLLADEIVHVHPDQNEIAQGYVRVIHGGDKKLISIFSYSTLNGPTPKAVVETPETPANVATSEPTAVPTPVAKTKPEKVEKPKSGITVLDKLHSKSGAVVAIVKDYVAKNPAVTLEQLKTVFPDTLLRRFGIFQEISKAKEIANGGNRYFFKPEHHITLADGTVLVVCNQITSDNIKPFIETSRALGYEIEVHD